MTDMLTPLIARVEAIEKKLGLSKDVKEHAGFSPERSEKEPQAGHEAKGHPEKGKG